jgi:hypothetical protein
MHQYRNATSVDIEEELNSNFVHYQWFVASTLTAKRNATRAAPQIGQRSSSNSRRKLTEALMRRN